MERRGDRQWKGGGGWTMERRVGMDNGKEGKGWMCRERAGEGGHSLTFYIFLASITSFFLSRR